MMHMVSINSRFQGSCVDQRGDQAWPRSRCAAACSSHLHHPQYSWTPRPQKLCALEVAAGVSELTKQQVSLLQPQPHQTPLVRVPRWHLAAAVLLHLHVLTAGGAAGAELQESSLSSEGNIPTELSAAGEKVGPSLSSLLSGSNKKQVESCTRRCVPTCTRGGEGAPGLGPISMRKEIVVFKDGFRSRQYCLSECAQVCSLMNKDGSSSSSSSGSSNSSSGSSSGLMQHQWQLQPLGGGGQ